MHQGPSPPCPRACHSRISCSHTPEQGDVCEQVPQPRAPRALSVLCWQLSSEVGTTQPTQPGASRRQPVSAPHCSCVPVPVLVVTPHGAMESVPGWGCVAVEHFCLFLGDRFTGATARCVVKTGRRASAPHIVLNTSGLEAKGKCRAVPSPSEWGGRAASRQEDSSAPLSCVGVCPSTL